MSDNVNEVQSVTEDNTLQEIHPEYVYLTIPSEYVCVYHKLLTYMADFGKSMIDDCTASCKGNGKNILTCWNLFQSAIACKALGRTKEADFFMEYIIKQLDLIYKGSDSDVYTTTAVMPITDDGKLKALVTCGTDIKFFVDAETGRLYTEYLASNAED